MLTLTIHLCQQKRLELCSQDEGVPNVAVLVQELFMSLFISVYNHEEEDGRYTAESFCELPDYDEVCGVVAMLGVCDEAVGIWEKDVEV